MKPAAWFASAREVFDEQGAAPLRAICDLDEALPGSRQVIAPPQTRCAGRGRCSSAAWG